MARSESDSCGGWYASGGWLFAIVLAAAACSVPVPPPAVAPSRSVTLEDTDLGDLRRFVAWRRASGVSFEFVEPVEDLFVIQSPFYEPSDMIRRLTLASGQVREDYNYAGSSARLGEFWDPRICVEDEWERRMKIAIDEGVLVAIGAGPDGVFGNEDDRIGVTAISKNRLWRWLSRLDAADVTSIAVAPEGEREATAACRCSSRASE